MEFAQTLLRLLRLLEKLDGCRTRRQFWYPTPGALWTHFRGTNKEEDDREGEDEQANDGECRDFDGAEGKGLSQHTRTNYWVRLGHAIRNTRLSIIAG